MIIRIEFSPNGMRILSKDETQREWPEFGFCTGVPTHTELLFGRDNLDPCPDGMLSIYVLFRGDLVVYIGQSRTSCINRIESHEAAGLNFDGLCALAIPPDLIDVIEAVLIWQYKPEYNKDNPLLQINKRIKRGE